MIKRMLVLAVACTLSSMSYGQVDSTTGNYWYADCKESSYSCLTFVVGILQGAQAVIAINEAKDPSHKKLDFGFCRRNDVTTGQYRDVYMKYLDTHPESRNLNAGILALTAWDEAWPCPK